MGSGEWQCQESEASEGERTGGWQVRGREAWQRMRRGVRRGRMVCGGSGDLRGRARGMAAWR